MPWLLLSKFLFTVLVSMSWLAHGAGSGWVSSGGELFRYDKNPWFVKNTPQVNYCISFDQNGISTSHQSAEQAIEQAIAFWKSEFSRAHRGEQGFARLGTQQFVYHASCPAQPDIVFKFGYGALSADEVSFLKDPQKYIGVTVRTSPYDRVNMRGSGFIFVSSDRGAKAYHNKGNLIDEAWSQPNLLRYALIHELGHVFGIPHSSTGLMSEVFMDQLVHKRFSRHFIAGDLKSFLHPAKELRVCGALGEFSPTFFGLPTGTTCLILKETQQFQYQVFTKASKEGPLIEVGTVKLTSTTMKEMGARPATLIHLPEEQTVFPISEFMLNSYMIGPVFSDVGGRGVFRRAGSLKPYHLYMEIKPEGVTLVGNVGGKPLPVFVYSEPLMMKIQFPL